jgi:hypothetical protein
MISKLRVSISRNSQELCPWKSDVNHTRKLFGPQQNSLKVGGRDKEEVLLNASENIFVEISPRRHLRRRKCRGTHRKDD